MDPAWFAAIVAGIGAVTTGLGLRHTTNEMKRWRGQQRETKQAEVAAEVLVVSIRFLAGLRGITSLAFRHEVSESHLDDEHDPGRENAELNWKAFEGVSEEFTRVWQLAEVYLADEVSDLLERISEESRQIWINQQTFLHMPIGHAREEFYRGWGKTPQTRIDALREELRSMLRPIAQLDPNDDRAELAAKQMKQLQAKQTKVIQEEVAKQLKGSSVKQLAESTK